MEYPNVRHPDCADVHLGLCPKCRRLYDKDRRKAEEWESVSDLTPVERKSLAVSEEELEKRIETAKGHARKEAMTNAERQKRWRERQGEAYREWNRKRMRCRRQGGVP